MMQLDGTPVPRLPDAVPTLPPAEQSRPSYHEALRVAHQVHAHTMARGKHRHGGTGVAVLSGVLLMALLVGGFLAVNHYVWSDGDGADDGRFAVETELFSASLPAAVVEQAQAEVVLGVAARVATRSALAADVTVTIVEFDMDMVAPGGSEDPVRVEGLRQSGHDAVVLRTGLAPQPSTATTVDGRAALVTTTVRNGHALSITSVLQRSTLVSVVCESVTDVMSPECAKVIDSIDLH